MHIETTSAEEARYAELQHIALECAREGQMEPLASMIQAGLPANLADAKGNTLLMLACYHDHLDVAWMLLQHGAEPDRRNDRGQTPLGGAAFKGFEPIVTLLLEYGANINADNGGGMTPIMFAALFGRFKVVTLLEKHGASLKHRSRLGVSAGWLVRLSKWIADLKRLLSTRVAPFQHRRTVHG